MKPFKTIKMNLAKCCYYPNQTNHFNMKRLLAILAGFFVVVTQFAYLFHEADTVTEYVSSAYMSVSALGIFISMIDTTSKTETIFKLIDNEIGESTKRSEFSVEMFLYSFFKRKVVNKNCMDYRFGMSSIKVNLHKNPSDCRTNQ